VWTLSLRDGQIDFKTIFSKLAQYDLLGSYGMECCIKTKKMVHEKVPEFIKSYYKSYRQKHLMILLLETNKALIEKT
jgi:sugar phosphate isomerase/epimerase